MCHERMACYLGFSGRLKLWAPVAGSVDIGIRSSLGIVKRKQGCGVGKLIRRWNNGIMLRMYGEKHECLYRLRNSCQPTSPLSPYPVPRLVWLLRSADLIEYCRRINLASDKCLGSEDVLFVLDDINFEMRLASVMVSRLCRYRGMV